MPRLASGAFTTEAVGTGRTRCMQTEGAKAGACVGQQPCAIGQLLCSHSCWCASNERGRADTNSTMKTPTNRATTMRLPRRDPQR